MFNTIKITKILVFAIFIILLFTNCNKNKFIDITYVVNITPLVDSLPCKAQIEYDTWTEKESLTVEENNWTMIKKSRIDTYVKLKVTGNTNVKSIKIIIGGYRNSPTIEQCDNTNCIIEGRYDLYGD